MILPDTFFHHISAA